MGWRRLAAFLMVFLSIFFCNAQKEDRSSAEEIYLFFNVPVYGGTDIPAVLKDNSLFLPVNVIFDFLRINQQVKPGLDSISGFFLSEHTHYLIDRPNHCIILNEQKFITGESDFIRTESNLFLKTDWFGKVFGLECAFDYTTLTVTLNTRLELPFVRELRQEQMRKSISRIKGEQKADTALARSTKWIHLGAVDWSVMARQQMDNPPNIRLNMALGGVIAGGSANVSLNYSPYEPFDTKQQYYLWHYADNRHTAVRQVLAGKVAVNQVSTLRNSLIGVQVTNTPTGFRRSFCTYTLSDYTEPGWIVELYVNHMLIDYVKADASGFFTFEVPLTYGSTQVLLRFYGPWGEERTRQQFIRVPYFFLPPGRLEYSVSAGFLEDGRSSLFGRAVANYGINRKISATMGFEYLSSVKPQSFMPLMGLSWRLAPTLLLTGEYVHGVRSSGMLSYRLPGDLLIEMNYVNYVPGQTAISTNFLEERKLMISKPIRNKYFSAYIRFLLNQIIMSSFRNTTGELLISGIWSGISINATTFALISRQIDPTVYTTLALGFRLPGGLNLIPQAQFEYTRGQFVSLKSEVEKRIGKQGSLSVSYEQNFYSNFSNAMATFRYNLPFAQATLTSLIANGKPGLNEAVSGSLLMDRQTGYFRAKNRSSVGTGGIVVLPFLDMNYNGIRDPGEYKAYGLTLKSNNGMIEVDRKDTLIRINDLEPYTTYFLELDPAGFENVSWRISQSTLLVPVEPNQYRLIEVPVRIAGEVNGKVVCQSGHSKNTGKGRILVCIYNSSLKLIARTMSEPDGFFSYMGLQPGDYFLKFDQEQMNKSLLTPVTKEIGFTIRPDRNGDISSGHEMVLSCGTAAGP